MTDLKLPERLNAAQVLIDLHVTEGRAAKTAILCGDEAVTYGELQEAVNRVGNALRTLGVRIEERVAILLNDRPQWVYAFFGAMKIGAVAVPLNTMLRPRDYAYMLNDNRARVLVVEASLLPKIVEIRDGLEHLEHIVVVGSETSGHLSLAKIMGKAAPSLDAANTTRDDAAFWLYSSGTTSVPKGTIHLHHDMLVEADLYARGVLGLRESDVSFSVAKLFFAYGLGNGLYFPLRTGGTAILLPDRPTPDKVYEVIDRLQPTVFYGVPTSYVALLHAAEELGRTSLGRVRMCVSAGEPLPAHLFNRWKERYGVEVLDGIGSTEILHIFISNRPGQARAGSTGRIVPGYEAKIVDDQGAELPPGRVGALLIKGESIAAGYWNKHEQTKETFRGEWIHTHDSFQVDEDGFYWYAGRTDDMIRVSGQPLWPSDVESILQQHSAVLESGVVGAPDEDGLIKPCAFVVVKDKYKGVAGLDRELQEFVKKNAAPYKYPRSVIFVDDLPKTATGKIQRFQLRQMAAHQAPK